MTACKFKMREKKKKEQKTVKHTVFFAAVAAAVAAAVTAAQCLSVESLPPCLLDCLNVLSSSVKT